LTESNLHAGSSAGDDRYPSPYTAWYFIVILALASVVSYLDRQILNLLVDPIRRDLLISDTQISLLQGIGFSFFYAVAGLWIGGLIDRRNRRNIVAAGIFGWSLMTAYCGLADTYWELLAGRIGVAVGEACLIPASYSLLGDLFDGRHRGRAAGVLSTGMALGNGLSLLVSGLLLAALDESTIASLPAFLPRVEWQLVFIIVGLLGLPVVLLLFTVREPRRLGVVHNAAPIPIAGVVRFLRENWAAILSLFGATSLMMAASSGLIAWGPTILIRELGQARAEAGFSMGVALLTGGAIGPLIMGYVSDRNVASGVAAPRMRLFAFAGPVMALGVILVALARGPTLALAGMFVVMMCAVGFATMLYTAIQDICPNQLRGRIVAVASICTNVFGLGIGPTLVAVAKDSALLEHASLAASYGIVGVPIVAMATALAVAGFGPFSRAQARVRAR
jgi:MFS family permease